MTNNANKGLTKQDIADIDRDSMGSKPENGLRPTVSKKENRENEKLER